MKATPTYSRKANGKLLLTSEYYVLDGALALAIPTKFGQSLKVQPSTSFEWKSIDADGNTWLEYDSNNKESETLLNILNSIQGFEMKNAFEIKADYPRDWGLGSSSTLIALLADYFKVNPYKLNNEIFKGSGYDIACAFAESPILYSNARSKDTPLVEKVLIPNEISQHCYFVYVNKKQDSREGIHHYKSVQGDKLAISEELSQLTTKLIQTNSIDDWVYLLNSHEEIIAKNLQLERIKNTLLKDCPYFCKSLGAWGGDFALVVTDENYKKVKKFFKKRGFNTIFDYENIINDL